MKKSLGLLSEVYSRKVLVKEATIPTEIKFGKHYLFRPGTINPTTGIIKSQPYSSKIPNVHPSTQKNLDELVSLGATFSKIVTIRPDGASSPKTTLGYGKSDKGEDFVFERSPAASATAPMIYFKDRKMNIYVFINDLMSKTNPVTVDDILKVIVSGTYTINSDGTVDVKGSVNLHRNKIILSARRSIVLDDIPVKFGVVDGLFNLQGDFKNISTRLPSKCDRLSIALPSNYKDLSLLENTIVDKDITVEFKTTAKVSCKGLNPTFNGELRIAGNKVKVDLLSLPVDLKKLNIYNCTLTNFTGCSENLEKIIVSDSIITGNLVGLPNKVQDLLFRGIEFNNLIGLPETIYNNLVFNSCEIRSFKGIASSKINRLIFYQHYSRTPLEFDEFPKEVNFLDLSGVNGVPFSDINWSTHPIGSSAIASREQYDKASDKEKTDFYFNTLKFPNLEKIKTGIVLGHGEYGPEFDKPPTTPTIPYEEFAKYTQTYLDALYKDGLEDVPIDI